MGNKVKLSSTWIVINSKKNPKTCILCLPGRASHARELCTVYSKFLGMNDHLIVGVTPQQFYWYPMPNGVGDQDEAVQGIAHARNLVYGVVDYIETNFGIPRENTVVLGHSAGAVMAIQSAAYSPRPFAGVISHSGAILDPDGLPSCRDRTTNYLLTHNRGDIIFEWHERYLPMLDALRQKGYPVFTVEEDQGHHGITEKQFILSRCFINACFKGSPNA